MPSIQPRSRIRAPLIILALVLVGMGSFRFGSFMESRARTPIEIRNNCAYFDMESGAFTWGSRPVVIGRNEKDEPEIFGAAARPIKKGSHD